MSNNEIITTDLQSQEVDALIELYELELQNGTILYFHPGLDENLDEIVYDGNTYIALPLIFGGIETASEGAANRPTLTIANVTNVFKAAISGEGFSFEDLIGSRITRRQTLEKYLASAAYEMPRSIYLLDRISSENSVSVTFDLAAPFDVAGIKIPNRVVIGKYCSWVYQGLDRSIPKGGCKWRENSSFDYDGVQYFPYFDLNDSPLIESGTVTIATYSVPHSLDDFIVYNGKYYRSEADSNSEIPGSSILWKEVFFWEDWSAVSSYSVGEYVRRSSHIWRALASNINQEPAIGSVYWKRVDYCGKTLDSCKARFQFVPTTEGAPSVIKETDKVLPFGAFPGSVKFK